MKENEITQKVIDAAITVHRHLGPGLLESSYKECLYSELVHNEIHVMKEVGLPLIYRDTHLDCGYRIDLWVEHKVIIAIKSVESLTDVHLAQVLTYIKLSDCRVGLLINFNVTQLIKGIRRVVNNYKE
jgi:GxxExxY protein